MRALLSLRKPPADESTLQSSFSCFPVIRQQMCWNWQNAGPQVTLQRFYFILLRLKIPLLVVYAVNSSNTLLYWYRYFKALFLWKYFNSILSWHYHQIKRSKVNHKAMLRIYFWTSCFISFIFKKYYSTLNLYSQKPITIVLIKKYQKSWFIIRTCEAKNKHTSYFVFKYWKRISKIQILTGKGLATPIFTIPAGAPFRACTASSRLLFSRFTSLTNMRRSPGRRRPSFSATPPGTKERITITVLTGSTGSWQKAKGQSRQLHFTLENTFRGCPPWT